MFAISLWVCRGLSHLIRRSTVEFTFCSVFTFGCRSVDELKVAIITEYVAVISSQRATAPITRLRVYSRASSHAVLWHSSALSYMLPMTR